MAKWQWFRDVGDRCDRRAGDGRRLPARPPLLRRGPLGRRRALPRLRPRRPRARNPLGGSRAPASPLEARLAAHRGELAEAVALAQRAVELAERSDMLNLRARVWLALAEVQRAARRDGRGRRRRRRGDPALRGERERRRHRSSPLTGARLAFTARHTARLGPPRAMPRTDRTRGPHEAKGKAMRRFIRLGAARFVAVTAIAAAIVLAMSGLAHAGVDRIQITSVQSPTFGGTSFGTVGQYEKVRGTITGAVDPTDPRNAVDHRHRAGAAERAGHGRVHRRLRAPEAGRPRRRATTGCSTSPPTAASSCRSALLDSRRGSTSRTIRRPRPTPATAS